MKMKKKAMSLLLVFAMVAGLFIGISFDAEAQDYDLYIGGVRVTSDAHSGQGWSYDYASNTLTLSGLTVNDSFNGSYIDYRGNGIFKIELKNTNTIKNYSSSHCIPVIDAHGKLIIEGEGILNVESQGESNDAIDANSIEISGGTVNVNSKDSAGIYVTDVLIINGGKVKVTSPSCQGVVARGSVVINGGDVHIESGNFGIETDNYVTIGKNVNNVEFITTIIQNAICGTVKNAVAGTGWTNIEGTQGITPIDVSTAGHTLDGYKKIQFPASVAKVKTKPTAKTLTYTGNEQELVTPGEATGGTLQYALGTETEATTDYSTEIPKGKDAETYYVWYKAVGDETHTDSDAKYVTSKINSVVPPAPTPRNVLDGANQVVAYGKPASFEFDIPFILFRQSGKVYVDGVETDSKNYDAKPGSTIITLKDEFIKTLSEGAHEILVTVDGYEASTSFTVKKADAPNTDNETSGESTPTANTTNTSTTTPTSTTSKVTSPKTSDTIPIVAILILALGIGTIGIAAYKKRD